MLDDVLTGFSPAAARDGGDEQGDKPTTPTKAKRAPKEKGTWEGGYWKLLPSGRRAYRIYKRRCKLCGGIVHNTTVGYSLEEAQAYFEQWTANGHRDPGQVRREQEAADPHLADAVAEFNEWLPTHAKSRGTRKDYKAGMKRWCIFLAERGVSRMSGLRRGLWIDFPAWRRKQPSRRNRPIGNTAVYLDQSAMRCFIKWALTKEYLEHNPFPVEKGCKAVKVNTESQVPRDVPLADVKKLSKALLNPVLPAKKRPGGRPRRPGSEEACNLLLWAIYYWGPRAASWRREWTLNERDMSVYFPGTSTKNGHELRLKTADRKKFDVLVRLKKVGTPPAYEWDRRIREAAQQVNLEHRGHDMRAGCAQRLEDEGKHLTDVMHIMQWSKYETARRYLKRERNMVI